MVAKRTWQGCNAALASLPRFQHCAAFHTTWQGCKDCSAASQVAKHLQTRQGSNPARLSISLPGPGTVAELQLPTLQDCKSLQLAAQGRQTWQGCKLANYQSSNTARLQNRPGKAANLRKFQPCKALCATKALQKLWWVSLQSSAVCRKLAEVERACSLATLDLVVKTAALADLPGF